MPFLVEKDGKKKDKEEGLPDPLKPSSSSSSSAAAALPTSVDSSYAAVTPISGGNRGLSGGAIAAVVIGVLFAVVVFGGLATWWYLRRRKAAAAARNNGTIKKNFDTLNAAPSDLGSEKTLLSELHEDDLREMDAGKDSTAKYELDGQNKVKETVMKEGKSGEKDGGLVVELEGCTPTQEGKQKFG